LYGGRYASIKKEAEILLKENNIVHVDWNALNGDSEISNLTVEMAVQRVKETVGQKNSIVLLMHDSQTKLVTLEALSHIISYLKEQEYEFKNFYEIIK